ncbi:hypothetical protein DFH08DRAFT_940954 [Mycena albidolilacea]|uniref:Uncharacterized protein n=1 Tax=Mycena albidolilacea TaxID=1033008 RepID=A0AAD6ZKF2_9AGAR|nr:hypothetical protein DFH08DRAFT_940954 [Mycena albidolilacea]
MTEQKDLQQQRNNRAVGGVFGKADFNSITYPSATVRSSRSPKRQCQWLLRPNCRAAVCVSRDYASVERLCAKLSRRRKVGARNRLTGGPRWQKPESVASPDRCQKPYFSAPPEKECIDLLKRSSPVFRAIYYNCYPSLLPRWQLILNGIQRWVILTLAALYFSGFVVLPNLPSFKLKNLEQFIDETVKIHAIAVQELEKDPRFITETSWRVARIKLSVSILRMKTLGGICPLEKLPAAFERPLVPCWRMPEGARNSDLDPDGPGM